MEKYPNETGDWFSVLCIFTLIHFALNNVQTQPYSLLFAWLAVGSSSYSMHFNCNKSSKFIRWIFFTSFDLVSIYFKKRSHLPPHEYNISYTYIDIDSNASSLVHSSCQWCGYNSNLIKSTTHTQKKLIHAEKASRQFSLN